VSHHLGGKTYVRKNGNELGDNRLKGEKKRRTTENLHKTMIGGDMQNGDFITTADHGGTNGVKRSRD